MDANDRRTRAASEAAEWWLQLQSAEMPREQREKFVDWLRESAVHVEAMLRVAQIHNALEQFERWTQISTEGPAGAAVVDFPGPRAQPSADKRPRNRTGLAAAIAASVIAFAIIIVWLTMPNLRAQTLATERGERREVALADGSILQIDPETTLRVQLEAGARKIVLERGRALFRVAKDPNRPFTVRAGDTLVRAVGTAFAVEHDNHDIKVTVAEGKVTVARQLELASPRRPKGLPASSQETLREVLLAADEQLTVKQSASASAVRKVDTHRELAWTEGRLIFDNTAVADALAAFNRYNRIQLHVSDPALAARPISGVFDASDPESLIAFIQTVTHVRIVRGDDQDITIASEP